MKMEKVFISSGKENVVEFSSVFLVLKISNFESEKRKVSFVLIPPAHKLCRNLSDFDIEIEREE